MFYNQHIKKLITLFVICTITSIPMIAVEREVKAVKDTQTTIIKHIVTMEQRLDKIEKNMVMFDLYEKDANNAFRPDSDGNKESECQEVTGEIIVWKGLDQVYNPEEWYIDNDGVVHRKDKPSIVTGYNPAEWEIDSETGFVYSGQNLVASPQPRRPSRSRPTDLHDFACDD